ncbi:MAG: glycosyltransferase family 4 protein [Gemmatimonadota bacterium]
MKILLINWQDPANPHAGGAEVHLHEIFRRLVGAGHRVDWLASGWRGAEPRSRLDGISLHRTGTRYTFGLAVAPYYRRYLAGKPYDLVVEALNKVPVYTPLWCHHPVVLLVHHLFGTTAFREAPVPIAALTWVQERPIPRVYRGVPMQVISRSTADDLVARGVPDSSIEVIFPGVDLAFFRSADPPTRAAGPTFLYLGRLQRYKQVDLIVRAFAGVRSSLPSARLVIAGKGDQEEALHALAASLGVAEHVDFPGFVSEERKRELFRTCWSNVFVSPKEGWGITNLEAAACGTATIASDSAGLRESVVNGRTGVLVPHGDLDALAAAMLRLGGSLELTERLGAGALEFARGFSWEAAVAATEAHLIRSRDAQTGNG